MFIGNIIKPTKSFPPIFKIINIIAVPNNSQSIGLIKLDSEMFGMLKDVFSFKQFFFSYHKQKQWLKILRKTKLVITFQVGYRLSFHFSTQYHNIRLMPSASAKFWIMPALFPTLQTQESKHRQQPQESL